MREPVSTSAVAMIVLEPPSSMLQAAAKKRFDFCSAFESRPPDSTLPEGGAAVSSLGNRGNRAASGSACYRTDRCASVVAEAAGSTTEV